MHANAEQKKRGFTAIQINSNLPSREPPSVTDDSPFHIITITILEGEPQAGGQRLSHGSGWVCRGDLRITPKVRILSIIQR